MSDYVWLVYQTDSTTTIDVLKGIGTTEEEANNLLTTLRAELKRNADIDFFDGEECYDDSFIRKRRVNQLF